MRPSPRRFCSFFSFGGHFFSTRRPTLFAEDWGILDTLAKGKEIGTHESMKPTGQDLSCILKHMVETEQAPFYTEIAPELGVLRGGGV